MKRFWFRVEIDQWDHQVVKILVQAPDEEAADKIMRKIIDECYPEHGSELKVLNKNIELSDEICYAVFGDGESTHYSSLTPSEVK